MLNIIRETHIKTTMQYHYTSTKVTQIKNSDNTKHWQEYGANETLIYCWYKYFGKISQFPTNYTYTYYKTHQFHSQVFTQEKGKHRTTETCDIYITALFIIDQNLRYSSTEMSINRYEKLQTVVYTHDRIMLSNEKNALLTCTMTWINLNMDGFQKYYVEQQMSDTEYILYDLFIWNASKVKSNLVTESRSVLLTGVEDRLQMSMRVVLGRNILHLDGNVTE